MNEMEFVKNCLKNSIFSSLSHLKIFFYAEYMQMLSTELQSPSMATLKEFRLHILPLSKGKFKEMQSLGNFFPSTSTIAQRYLDQILESASIPNNKFFSHKFSLSLFESISHSGPRKYCSKEFHY